MIKSVDKIKSIKIFIIILLILIFGVLQKIILLNNDSDENFSFGMFADEGYKSFNARNLFYFGDNFWHPQDEYIGWHTRSPVMTQIYYFSFKIFGVHLFSVRIVTILFYFFSMFIIYFICKTFYKPKKFFLIYIFLFFSFSYIYFLYSRIGFLEVPANLFLLVITFACFSIIKQKRIKPIILYTILFIGGFLTVFFTKLTSLISVVGILTGTIFAIIIISLKKKEDLKIEKKIKIFKTVFLSAIVIFFLCFFLFTSIDTLRSLFYQSRPFNNPLSIFIQLFKMRTIAYNPIIFFLGAVYSIYILLSFTSSSKLRKIFDNEKANFILFDFIFALWFIISFLITIAFEYHPTRYFLHSFIPLFFLSARVLSLPKAQIKDIIKTKNISFKILIILISLITFTSVFFSISMSLNGFTSVNEYLEYGIKSLLQLDILQILYIFWPIVTGIIVIILAFIILKRIKPRILHMRFILLSLFLIIQLGLYFNWFSNSGDDIYRISKELGEIIPKNEILAGDLAPSLGLENDLKTLYVSFVDEQFNFENLINIKPDNFIFITKHFQDEEFIKLYPEVYRNSILLKEFKISRFDIELRKLNWDY